MNGDLVLDRKKVEESQATLPKPRRDVGIVYIYRESGRDCPNCWTAISIGEALVGLFHPGQFIRLQLPAGRYWLRAPVPVRIGRTVDKDYLQRKRRGAGFLLVDVQPGHSYYVKEKTPTHLKAGDTELEQVDQATGADAVLAAQCWADMGLQDIAQELLPHLQASPTAERDKSH